MKLLLVGACGKMGRMIAQNLPEDMQIAAGVDKFPCECAFPVYENISLVQESCDVLIDFSRPDALADVLAYAVEKGVPCVLATTGYDEAALAAIGKASESIAIFKTANMSYGINVLAKVLAQLAPLLADFDKEIVETHHNMKVDAPSGTALLLADAMNVAKEDRVYGRTPESGKREKNEVGIHALRGGTVTGEHQVFFFGADEVIEIRHSAQSRAVFAQGALRAARFLAGKQPGLYSMQDMI